MGTLCGDQETVLQTIAYAEGGKVGGCQTPDPDALVAISMALSSEAAKDALRRQFDLSIRCVLIGQHIKPHGALYNDLFHDDVKAKSVVEVIQEYSPNGTVYCAPGSAFSVEAKAAGLNRFV